MTALDSRIKQQAIPNGLLLGVLMLVLSIVAFYIMISSDSFWVVSLTPFSLSIIVPIILAIIFCFSLRKKVGGYWTFRQATTGIFIMFILAYLVQFIGRDLIFAKIVEPQMVEKTQNAVKKATLGYLNKSGLDQTKIDEQEEKIDKQFDAAKKSTIVSIISGVAISVLLVFVISAIFGALFKKDPPLFNTDFTEPEVSDPTV